MLNPVQFPRSVNSNRSIGAILVDAGRLGPDDAESVLRLHREKGLRFGEAAIKLGLLQAQDIEFALARQYDYSYLVPGDGAFDEELVAAYQPFGAQAEALRALRSQLRLRWFTDERKMLAVVSPGRSEGRSSLAANLAVSFSQLGMRTLLIDADLRHSRQHSLFRLDNRSGLSSLLANRGSEQEIRRIAAFDHLSVLPAGPRPPNPQELLSRPGFGGFLSGVMREFDVIFLDSPAADECADVHTIALRAGGVLLAARKHRTRLDSAGRLGHSLTQLGVATAAAVLRDF